ncbi:MAG: hypothetical protein ACI4MF_13190 [Candidatus Faecivicinus sp.]
MVPIVPQPMFFGRSGGAQCPLIAEHGKDIVFCRSKILNIDLHDISSALKRLVQGIFARYNISVTPGSCNRSRPIPRKGKLFSVQHEASL